jgi:hypothetical protein
MRIVPSISVPALGMPVQLPWRGVIGLADMLRRLVVDIDHLLMPTKVAAQDLSVRLRTDPLALVDPIQATTLIKNWAWAKQPGGPWIAVADHLRLGQGAVRHAVERLISYPTRRQELISLFGQNS